MLLCAIAALASGATGVRAGRATAAARVHGGLSIAGVSTDASKRTVTLTGLAAGSGSLRVTVGALTLPLPGSPGTGASGLLIEAATSVQAGASAPSKLPQAAMTISPKVATPAGPAPVSADDIAITRGKVTIRIKHIAMTGTTLGQADLAALFGTGDVAALEARLRALDAASITIPEIAIDAVDPGHEEHFLQKDVLLANVVHGKAAVGSGGNAVFRSRSAIGATQAEIGAVSVKGVDLAQIAHVLGATRTADDEALLALVEAVDASAVKIMADEKAQPLTIAIVRERGVKARPLRTGFSDAGGKALVDDLAHSLSVDLIEADDLALLGPPLQEASSLKAFGLKHVAFHALGDGRLGRFEIAGLGLEGTPTKPGKLLLGSAIVENIALRTKPSADKETIAFDVPRIDRVDLRDIALDFTAASRTGPSERLAFSLAHAGYDAPGLEIGKLPTKAKLSVDHIVFDVPPESRGAPVLLAMGYRQIDASSESVSTYDAAKRSLVLDRLDVSGIGMGSIGVKLGLENVSEGIVSQDDRVQQAAAMAMIVQNVDLTLRNDGLIDKAIAFKAAIDGVTVEQERDSLVAAAKTMTAGIGDPPKLRPIGEAVARFLAEPRTLHLALRATPGLGIADMAQMKDPLALLDTMEIEAKAND